MSVCPSYHSMRRASRRDAERERSMKLETRRFVGVLDTSDPDEITRLDGIGLSSILDAALFQGREVVVTVRQLFPGESDMVRELIEAERREV